MQSPLVAECSMSDWTMETGVNMSAVYVGAGPIDALWTNGHNPLVARITTEMKRFS